MEEGGTRLSESPGLGSCVLLLGGTEGAPVLEDCGGELLHGGLCHLVGCLPGSP